MELEEIIMKSGGGIFNNAAQVFNHTFYWNCLAPTAAASPKASWQRQLMKPLAHLKSSKSCSLPKLSVLSDPDGPG